MNCRGKIVPPGFRHDDNYLEEPDKTMIAELFTNNALNLVIIFGSCAALILMSFGFAVEIVKKRIFIPCGAIFNLHHNY